MPGSYVAVYIDYEGLKVTTFFDGGVSANVFVRASIYAQSQSQSLRKGQI